VNVARASLEESLLDYPDPTIRANATICLIHRTNQLLDQQIAALEEAFIEEGGYSEQLATERLSQGARRPFRLAHFIDSNPRQAHGTELSKCRQSG
jgi:four helix bundle suffix protein